MSGKITTALTKREARIYQAQGLHKEARKLYDGLLASTPNIDPELKSVVQTQIKEINQELAHSDTSQGRQLTAAEIACMKKSLGEKSSAADMLVCAQAFIQVGSYDEALTEFKKLLHTTGVKKNYMNAIAECLVHLHNPPELPLAAEQLAQSVSKTTNIFLAMQLALAKEIVTLEYIDHAQALAEHLRKYPQLSTCLDQCMAALSDRCKNTCEPDTTEANASPPSEDTVDPCPSLAERFNPLNLFRNCKKSKKFI